MTDIRTHLAQARYSENNRQLIGRFLSHTITLAKALGTLADDGKQFTVKQKAASLFVGSVQLGEYLMTGLIPERDLVKSLLVVE